MVVICISLSLVKHKQTEYYCSCQSTKESNRCRNFDPEGFKGIFKYVAVGFIQCHYKLISWSAVRFKSEEVRFSSHLGSQEANESLASLLSPYIFWKFSLCKNLQFKIFYSPKDLQYTKQPYWIFNQFFNLSLSSVFLRLVRNTT